MSEAFLGTTVRDYQVLARLGSGLLEVHDAGIVHRDISPEHIILAREGGVDVAKLIEFGLASAPLPSGPRLACASPERLGLIAGGLDARSDVYALGLSLYEA